MYADKRSPIVLISLHGSGPWNGIMSGDHRTEATGDMIEGDWKAESHTLAFFRRPSDVDHRDGIYGG